MPVLALSALDILIGAGLAVAGFVVVALVCAAVLAALQVVLPSTDSGAAEIDRADAAGQPGEGDEGADDQAGLDTGANA